MVMKLNEKEIDNFTEMIVAASKSVSPSRLRSLVKQILVVSATNAAHQYFQIGWKQSARYVDITQLNLSRTRKRHSLRRCEFN